MAASIRWKRLEREVEVLRSHFLPDPFDPIGSYAHPARVQTNTRAFLVLSHAEVESYLEGWTKDLTRAAEVIWDRHGRITPPLAFLLSASHDRLPVPDTMAGRDGPTRLGEVAKKALAKHYKLVKDNNGVKEKNLLALLLPLGLAAPAINATLCPNLDAFGTTRGTHAHQAASAVLTPLDPETEYKRVKNVLADLIDLDVWLLGYMRRVR